MMTKEGSTKIINFMTSGAGVHVLYKTYSENTLLNRLLYFWTWVTQTMYIEMMTKESSTKIVNFAEQGLLFLDVVI